MQRLSRGITGFYSFDTGEPPTFVNEKLWKQSCYQVAQRIGATVNRFEFQIDRVDGNYHAAIIAYHGQGIAVLCNAYYPVVAFTDQLTSRFGKIHFVESVKLATQFVDVSMFVPLELEFLCSYPAPEFLTELDPIEHKQIQSWRPTQIGDIIFHHWD